MSADTTVQHTGSICFDHSARSSTSLRVTVITSVGHDGELLGITANSFNSVSLEPPLVLFSLHRNAYSLSAFEAAGFVVIPAPIGFVNRQDAGMIGPFDLIPDAQTPSITRVALYDYLGLWWYALRY